MDNPISNLVNVLIAELSSRKEIAPTREILESLFTITFHSTLEKEEGKSIRFDLAYLNPDDPDPSPPISTRHDRWVPVKFMEPLPFEKKSISKVALATDNRTSLLLVYPDHKSELKIWGFIDQGINTFRFRDLETDLAHSYPGTFQVSAAGIGHLVVRKQFEQIAELRGESLTSKPLKALEKGALLRALSPFVEKLKHTSSGYVKKFGYEGSDDQLTEIIEMETLASIRRLLLRIQGYGHGGAILITPSVRRNQLNVKYKIEYRRLAQAIQKAAIIDDRDLLLRLKIAGDEGKSESSWSVKDYLTLIVSDEAEIQSELNGSLWFVSLLSRVDGLVLMDASLTVRGFGVEISIQRAPMNIWVARDLEGNKELREELRYEHYGTRHRSMMRYISRVPGSVGFVVSQDGSVKAMTMIDDDLIIWDNIQLQEDYDFQSAGILD